MNGINVLYPEYVYPLEEALGFRSKSLCVLERERSGGFLYALVYMDDCGFPKHYIISGVIESCISDLVIPFILRALHYARSQAWEIPESILPEGRVALAKALEDLGRLLVNLDHAPQEVVECAYRKGRVDQALEHLKETFS